MDRLCGRPRGNFSARGVHIHIHIHILFLDDDDDNDYTLPDDEPEDFAFGR